MAEIKPDALIVCHQKYDLLGNPEQVTCEWQGPKHGIAGMSGRLQFSMDPAVLKKPGAVLGIGDIITFGPYTLKVFEYEPMYDRFLLIRPDSHIGNLRVVIYRLTRWLDLIYRRLIITAAVWRLADYHEALIPSWRDLHIVKRFLK